jgi:hypothetical protein
MPEMNSVLKFKNKILEISSEIPLNPAITIIFSLSVKEFYV